MKKSYIDDIVDLYSDSTDFGFTSNDYDIDELKSKNDLLSGSNELYRERLQKIEALVMPLLVSLYKTSDKAIINWPNRGPIIEEKIKNLLELTRNDTFNQ